MHVYSRVLLPKWVFEANSDSEVSQNVSLYMQRYPHYAVVRLEDRFALCTEKEGE